MSGIVLLMNQQLLVIKVKVWCLGTFGITGVFYKSDLLSNRLCKNMFVGLVNITKLMADYKVSRNALDYNKKCSAFSFFRSSGYSGSL